MSKRIRLVNRELYAVDLEYTEEYAILHFPRFDKLTPSVFKELRDYVGDLDEMLKTLGFCSVIAVLEITNMSMSKLLKRIGFVFVRNVAGLDIFEYGVS